MQHKEFTVRGVLIRDIIHFSTVLDLSYVPHCDELDGLSTEALLGEFKEILDTFKIMRALNKIL